MNTVTEIKFGNVKNLLGLDKMAVIFDVDGTIANTEHRKHHVATKPKNWKAWNAEMINDEPNWDIVDMLQILRNYFTILIVSGRGEENKEVTETWFKQNGILYDKLYMRKEKDYRQDAIVKQEILDQIRKEGYNVAFVFDDRNQCVEMWRRNGIRCFQVADGSF